MLFTRSRIIEFKSFDDKRLARIWRQLEDSDEQCTVFQSYAWLKAWSSVYVADRKIRIFVETKGCSPVALASFMLENGRIRFLSDNSSDYAGLLLINKGGITPNALVQFICDLATKNQMILWNLRTSSPITTTLIESLSNSGLLALVNPESVYQANLRDHSKLTYWYTTSRNVRRSFRKKSALLSKQGISFKVQHAIDESILDQITTLHINRWKEKNIKSKFLDPNRREFVRAIAEISSPKTKFVLFSLCSKGRIIAYRLGFLDRGIYRDWNTSFDLNYRDASPGFILIGHIMEYLIEEKFTRFDFLRGEEDYKMKWYNKTETLLTLHTRKP